LQEDGHEVYNAYNTRRFSRQGRCTVVHLLTPARKSNVN